MLNFTEFSWLAVARQALVLYHRQESLPGSTHSSPQKAIRALRKPPITEHLDTQLQACRIASESSIRQGLLI